MKRTDIINHIVKKYNYKRYLEIGVRNPSDNFDKIIIEHKDGVDPAGKCNHPMTSDDFFNTLDIKTKYDLIFIDGLHLDYQVEKDIKNSLNHLNDDGTIIMHDCNPIEEEHQVEEYIVGKTWNGTTWKAYAKYRMINPNLNMYVINTDHGVGIIQRGTQVLFPKSETLNYKLLNDNRIELLKLISVEKFLTL